MKISLVALGFLALTGGVFAVGCADGAAEPGTPPAGAGAGAPADCGATPLAAGCDATKPAAGSAKAPASSGSGTLPDVTADMCQPKTCEDYKGACGSHDDGCGHSFSCGDCKGPSSCTPATCASLGQTCGNHDDGCGGTASCGACVTACATDAREPNDSQERATDLGAAIDSDDKTIATPDLDSSDGDVDWFKIAITDSLDFTNPTIVATATDAKLEVSVFHVCNSLPNYSYCYSDGGVQDNELGNGCHAMGSVTLKTDCSGMDESGTAYVRVRKTVSDATCHNYDLSVEVY